MSVTHLKSVPTLTELKQQLVSLKQQEEEIKAHRLNLERAIVQHPDIAPQLKDEGTHSAYGVKVSTGYTRKWDQDALDRAAQHVSPSFWPFKTEFKEDRRMMRVVEERFPDLYAQHLSPALTLTPRKPTVSIVEPKD